MQPALGGEYDSGVSVCALDALHSTNNFPEFIGRICPAPCEAACTLNIDDNPVTIQIEIIPKPPRHENKGTTWPDWPLRLRSSSSHEEGCACDWVVVSKEFVGENGKLKKIRMARVEWDKGDNGRMQMREAPGSEFELDVDMALLAMGYLHPVHEGLVEQSKVERDGRGNVKANDAAYAASVPQVYAAGDCRRGQSLVVWAIREERQCAHAVNRDLMGTTALPR